MENKFGIENLKSLLTVFMAFVMMGDKMGAENNWTSRMAHMFSFIPSLMGLGSIQWDKLDDEAGEINESEKAELVAHVKDKFDIIDDKLEALVEDGLEFAVYIGSVVSKGMEYVNRVKAYFKK